MDPRGKPGGDERECANAVIHRTVPIRENAIY
jgi:hypothetical protein